MFMTQRKINCKFIFPLPQSIVLLCINEVHNYINVNKITFFCENHSILNTVSLKKENS